MAHFIVTFRIAEDETYQKRYDALVDAVATITDGKVWGETTSFFAFEERDKTVDEVAAYLQLIGDLRREKDIVVVIDLDTRRKVIIGKLEDERQLTKYLGF